jgi:hypothetical protein
VGYVVREENKNILKLEKSLIQYLPLCEKLYSRHKGDGINNSRFYCIILKEPLYF